MAYAVQVTIDSTDPHALADWWAETLGWGVEASDETFIRQMISEGHATDADTLMHRGALVWREGAAIHPADEQLPRAPHLLPDGARSQDGEKSRPPLDVRTGDDDVETVRTRLIERGATVLHSGRQGPHTWVTMADPEGNEFCV